MAELIVALDVSSTREVEQVVDALGDSVSFYKIGLELMLKCPVQRVAEVPIHFANRVHGESKLSLREQVKYLRHLGRLYWYTASHRDRHRPVSLRLPAAEPWGSLSAEQTTIAA